MIITLPWPHRDLNPNSRVHHLQKARHRRAQREHAHILTRVAMLAYPFCRPGKTDGPVSVTYEFFAPSKRRFDVDNLYSSMKGAQDGMCEALGFDDYRIEPTLKRGAPDKENPRVEVVIGGEG